MHTPSQKQQMQHPLSTDVMGHTSRSLVGVVGTAVWIGCWGSDGSGKVLCERNTEFGPEGKNHVEE